MPEEVQFYAGPKISTSGSAPTRDDGIGSLRLRHGGGAGTALYIKESTGSGGWSSITTSGLPLSGAEAFMRSGAKAQTLDRAYCSTSAVSLTNGAIRYTVCSIGRIYAGQTVNTITFQSGGTALTAGTSPHQWAVLMDQTMKILAYTADLTSTAWSANSEQAFTITGGYTPSSTIFPVLGLCVAQTGGTLPTLQGITGQVALSGLAPIGSGSSTTPATGLTDPASAIAVAAVGTILPSTSPSSLFAFGYVS